MILNFCGLDNPQIGPEVSCNIPKKTENKEIMKQNKIIFINNISIYSIISFLTSQYKMLKVSEKIAQKYCICPIERARKQAE